MSAEAMQDRCTDCGEPHAITPRRCERYNGWTNYETWAVKLWIDNDEGSYRYWTEQAEDALVNAKPGQYEWQTAENQAVYHLGLQIKEEHEQTAPETVGVFADLLTAALSSVNWHEIAESLIETAKESA